MDVTYQALPSMGFSRQEYWSGVPFPSPGDPPDTGNEAVSPELAGGFFTTEPPGKCKMRANFPNTIFIQLLDNFWTTL